MTVENSDMSEVNQKNSYEKLDGIIRKYREEKN